MSNTQKVSDDLFFREEEYNGYPIFEVANNREFENDRRGSNTVLRFGVKKMQMLQHPTILKAGATFLHKHTRGGKLPAESNGAKGGSKRSVTVVKSGGRKSR